MTITSTIVVAVVVAASIAHAQQNYPGRPIRMIVPAAAGNAADIQTRLVASELSKQMGQQVVVDNRPGASGVVGFEVIAACPSEKEIYAAETANWRVQKLILR